MDIKTIILIWLIGLVLFVFYCVFRLKYLKEKYAPINPSTSSTTPNVFDYISKQQLISNITDLPGCELMKDDDFGVNAMGYPDCKTAFGDYMEKGYDFNGIYDGKKSLAEVCPATVRSEPYLKCVKQLMDMKIGNNQIMDAINGDMSTTINNRINDRLNSLNEIRSAMVPFVYSKDNTDFIVDMAMQGQLPQSHNDKLPMVDEYYKKRYEDLVEMFQVDLSAINVDAVIESTFFGRYRAIKGQYILLDNVNIVISYKTDKTEDNPSPEIDLVLSDDENIISYNVVSIKNYKQLANAVKINLAEKKVLKEGKKGKEMSNLIKILGMGSPSQLILTQEEYKTADDKKKVSYKLVNDNLDTILILEKL